MRGRVRSARDIFSDICPHHRSLASRDKDWNRTLTGEDKKTETGWGGGKKKGGPAGRGCRTGN